MIGVHPKNWRLLQAAADSFIQGNHYGFLIGGQFVRGNQRGGGESVTSLERDHVRALQLMQQAIPLVQNEPDHAAVGAFYVDLANQILSWPRRRRSLEAAGAHRSCRSFPTTNPAGDSVFDASAVKWRVEPPVDADGNPVFYHVPARYESAKSDGERWRLCPRASGRVALRPSRIDGRWHLPISFMGSLAWRRCCRSAARSTRRMTARLIPTRPFAVHTLTDDETIARLANGVKRFKLPAEFNFMRIYTTRRRFGKE